MSSSVDVALERLLREVMPRRLHKIALKDSMSLNGELGIDSIGLMSLAFRIEEEFQIDLMEHADKVATIRTMGDVRNLILELGQKAPS
ncbi:acyl carrier protein [Archangium lansingense]|uniref:Acyl carrier protein n=1 Tax=Archangium lansingense TaxID=2995310 RepID=A0ABT4ACP9_9BACT|nr:acyl carrier protein [Archangium lansinium]MCY1079441.1 acyl carrier protein [Archangium lansinium]